jgi:D-alanyl-D-alanine carboxypeptidase/D-alanyl-D-alanine-endopeptidase (penicillin-binding protein 4)
MSEPMRRAALLALVFGGWDLPSRLAAFAPPPTEVEKMMVAQHLPMDSLSYVVVDVDSGHVLAGHKPEVPRSPASTIKLLTTFASLDMLGPAYTWHTRALIRGELKDGVLDGDLILQGGGDPYMTLERWWSFARQLRTQGLKTITGDIVIDNHAFALADEDPGAFDGRPHRAYNVIPDALMVNFQSIQFHVVPNGLHRRIDISADPAPVNLTIDNRIRFVEGRCSAAANQVNFDVADDAADRVSFTGVLADRCLPQDLTRVLLKPAEYAFGTFVSLWHEMDGEFGGGLRIAATPVDARLFASFDSLTLAEIVRLTNKFSNNLMARHLLLTLGEERFGAPATVEKGVAALEEWGRAKGLDVAAIDIDNGSGLSRRTQISPAIMATVLRLAYHSRYAPEFIASLPLAGVDGTLRSRMQGSPEGAVRLKTGHIDGVSGIAGYVTARDGKTYAVVSLLNDPGVDGGAGEPVHAALVNWVLGTP